MNILFLLKPKNTVSFLYDDYTLSKGLERMELYGFTAFPVLSREGYYVGTVNEGDFLRYIISKNSGRLKYLEKERVNNIMRQDWNQPVKVTATVEDLLELVLNQNFVPVVDDRNLFVGIITRRDVIQHFGNKITELKEKMKEKG